MKSSVSIAAAALCAAAPLQAQYLVFNDDFNEGSFGPAWNVQITTGDGGAQLASGMAELTNDATAAGNANGSVFFSIPTLTYEQPYRTVLQENPGLVSWSFNMQQVRALPSGFNAGGYGAAVVLGLTSAESPLGNGYAVVLGNLGAPDPVRLVRVTGGLDSNANFTDLIVAGAPLNDPAASHMSLEVTYNPANDEWTLYGRNDGSSGFTDPAAGLMTELGAPAIDATYTDAELSHAGFLWNYSSAAGQSAHFDNLSVSVIPEPEQYATAGALTLLLLAVARRWKRGRRENRM